MLRYEIHSCEQMMELIQQLGLLPLLASGISGYSEEEMADEECRYIVFPDGGWDWPLRQGGFYQPLVVAAFLQLASQPLSHAGGWQYRRYYLPDAMRTG